MLYVIDQTGTDPFHNLAAEQVIFDSLDRNHSYLYLWQNDNTAVIGRYQNTYAQLDLAYCKTHDIRIVRRLSGGGTVYHDLNNLNYSFITDADPDHQINFHTFLEPIVSLLNSLGVPAQINGRNDLTVEGKKFSGNAQYIRQGRVMHHGTLLFGCDPEKIARLLHVPDEKIRSKGVSSVKSRVCSLKEYLPEEYGIPEFRKDLIRFLGRQDQTAEYAFSAEEEALIRHWQKTRYETWDWNFGRSPACTMTRNAYLPKVGSLELHLSVDHGILEEVQIFGDFFSKDGPEPVLNAIKGCPFREEALIQALQKTDVPSAIHGMDLSMLIKILLDDPA